MGEDGPAASAGRAPARGTDTGCIPSCTLPGGSVPPLLLPIPSFDRFIQILKPCFAVTQILFDLRELVTHPLMEEKGQ